MTSYLDRLIDYNNWSNRGLLEFLSTQSDDALDWTADGVFGTVRRTLEHVLSSELSYYRNLAGLPRVEAARPDHPSLEELRAISAEAAVNWESIVKAMPAADSMLELRDGPRAAGTVFTQLLVHGIEHRGHVWTILSSHDVSGLELDGWAHGIFHGKDAWPSDWGPEPAARAEFPTSEQG